MYKYLLLILAIGSLTSCSEKDAQQPNAVVKQQPNAVELVSALFEPTGTTRGDIKNFITFTNDNLHKNKSKLLSGLDDYLALVTDKIGKCANGTKFRNQVFEGSFGSFPSLRIIVEDKIIKKFYLVLPVGVSKSTVKPLLAKYSNYETFILKWGENQFGVDIPKQNSNPCSN